MEEREQYGQSQRREKRELSQLDLSLELLIYHGRGVSAWKYQWNFFDEFLMEKLGLAVDASVGMDDWRVTLLYNVPSLLL